MTRAKLSLKTSRWASRPVGASVLFTIRQKGELSSPIALKRPSGGILRNKRRVIEAASYEIHVHTG